MQARPHILVVDDDDRLRALLSRFLREHDFVVSQAENATSARQLLTLFAFDLMVLDVMMPGETGLELAASLPARPRLPILMLSARAETEDRVAGLEAGVDDYLTKPFEPKELLLRIRAVLRRAAPAGKAKRVSFGAYVFDIETGQLQQEGEAVYLASAESALLKALAESAGEPISREQLAQKLGQEAGNERSIDVQVTRLRKKIEPETSRPQFIQTVRGAGYVLNGAAA